MSVVRVVPAAPAMYSGGDTVVAGMDVTDDDIAPPYSNSFVLKKSADGFDADIVDPNFGDKRERIGGRSACLI